MSNPYKTNNPASTEAVETLNFEPIKGYPMLNWRGKRPFTSTHFYPAQLKEQHGSDVDGWLNKIYWGDNLQVMSHLLKHYRGKVDLVYIDPPFDSKADYRKTISLHGSRILGDGSAFEEKQYNDIWTNDEYLQFLFERLIINRELLSDDGTIYVHCDFHKNYLIRCLLDEVFGPENFVNEIVWRRKGGSALSGMGRMSVSTDTIFLYSKTQTYTFNDVRMKPDPDYVKDMFTKVDAKGRKYMITVVSSPTYRANLIYDYKGYATPPNGWRYSKETMKSLDNADLLYFPDDKSKQIYKKIYLDSYAGQVVTSLWSDISLLKGKSSELTGYPTQKPEQLIERIIKLSSHPGDLVFDCFMGSGTTQAVAMKLGRRFLGADINLGAIQTSTKRLIAVADECVENQQPSREKHSAALSLDLEGETEEVAEDEIDGSEKVSDPTTFYTGFEVYNVNNYEIFRNPVQAKDLLIEALELQKLQAGHLFDGERDGRLWKIMPVNKIATRQDLNEIISGLNLKALAERYLAAPNQPVEKITLVCMGHEPDLAATLNREVALSLNIKAGTKMPLDVEVLDILRDRNDLQFKRDSEAKVSVKGGQLVIEAFYPMNLLSKLSLQKEKVGDWREMVDSVMVDFNYDGAVFNPALVDIPEKNGLVSGSYAVPEDAGTIRVKITDVLSESLEMEVRG